MRLKFQLFQPLLILLFLTSFAVLRAQSKHVQIKINPLPAIDGLTFPTLNAGVEIGFKKNIGWYNELGIKYRKAYYEASDTAFLPFMGIKLLSEFRFYSYDEKDSNKRNYFALSAFYRQDNHNGSFTYYNEKDSANPIYLTDNYGSHRTIIGVRAALGIQHQISERIYFDWFLGLGCGYRILRTVNLNYEEVFMVIKPIDLSPTTERIKAVMFAKNETVFSWSLGVRIGFKLCNKN